MPCNAATYLGQFEADGADDAEDVDAPDTVFETSEGETVEENDGLELLADSEQDAEDESDASSSPDVVDEPPTDDFDHDDGITLSDAQALDSRIVHWENLNSEGRQDLVEPDSPGDSDYAGTDVRGLSWIEPVSDGQEDSRPEIELAEIEAASDETDAEEGIEMPSFLRAAPEVSNEPEPEDVQVEEIFEETVIEAELHPAEEDPVEEFAQQIETEATAYVADTVEEAIAPELEDFDAGDSVELDEAMLRELVSDIVRQELQGALGERITRNVRKLVRREIHRALAAHDLE